MRPIRRTDMTPRVEMTPLIDVIFLLLTFFIYSLVLMVRAELLPVALQPLGSAGEQATPAASHTLTIDRAGQLYLDRAVVTWEQFDAALTKLRDDPDKPVLFVAMAADSAADRGPVLMRVVERVQKSGLSRVVLVGPPGEAKPAEEAAP